MGYSKPPIKMNLLKRSCLVCKCDLYLDSKDTYVSKSPKGLLSKFRETKFYCIPCDRDIKINYLIK